MKNNRYTLENFLRLKQEGKVSDIHEYLKPPEIIDDDLAAYLIGCDRDQWYEASTQEGDFLEQSNSVSDIIGGVPLYETVGVLSRVCRSYVYFGLCERGEYENLSLRMMEKTYICSAFRSDSQKGLEFNRNFAAAMCRRVFLFYNIRSIPIAPHLYFPAFLNEARDLERGLGMESGLYILDFCDRVEVFTIDNVISEGMKNEMEYARRRGIPVCVHNFSRKTAENVVRSFLKDINRITEV